MTPRPDFSPLMLALFIRARAAHRRGVEGCSRDTAARRERASLRRLAKVTVTQMEFAWMGRLLDPVARTRLWAVLGHFPADFGIALNHGGQDG